jgi:hypothetical protein
MNLAQLLEITRVDLDDQVEPYLWSDAELIEAAADAEYEACRRARLLIDSSTAAVCHIAVTAANPLYALDERVLFVRRAKLGLEDMPLRRASYRDLDANVSGWETDTGTPTHYVTDFETGKIRLYPIPIVDDTISMTVVRLPLVPLTDTTVTLASSPEIKLHYHRSLRFWMMHRAYSKPDADAMNKGKAAESLAMFEAEFGKKSSAIDEEWIEREQAADPYDGTF